MSDDSKILEELENGYSSWSSNMKLFFDMVDEIDRNVPSKPDGTFLICSYQVGAVLQGSQHFHTDFKFLYRKEVENPCLCGLYKGFNLYLDKYMKNDDYRLLIRKGDVNYRDITIDNLLNDDTKLSEKVIDLSKYKILIK